MSPGANARGGGFTLVELLVIIAIIGVLVSELLPAIDTEREASGPSKGKFDRSSRTNLPSDGSPVSGRTDMPGTGGTASASFSASAHGHVRTGQLTNWANRGPDQFVLARQKLEILDPIGPITAPTRVQVSASLSGPASGSPMVDFTQSAAGSTASISIQALLNGETISEWGFTAELDEDTDQVEIIDEIGDFDPSDVVIDGKVITAVEAFSESIDLPAGGANEIAFAISASAVDGVVPEPTMLALLALGGLALASRKSRRR